jgi:hypothetical protein
VRPTKVEDEVLVWQAYVDSLVLSTGDELTDLQRTSDIRRTCVSNQALIDVFVADIRPDFSHRLRSLMWARFRMEPWGETTTTPSV